MLLLVHRPALIFASGFSMDFHISKYTFRQLHHHVSLTYVMALSLSTHRACSELHIVRFPLIIPVRQSTQFVGRTASVWLLSLLIFRFTEHCRNWSDSLFLSFVVQILILVGLGVGTLTQFWEVMTLNNAVILALSHWIETAETTETFF